jgi:ABC-type antimicrobial peptide transport system permease subunit
MKMIDIFRLAVMGLWRRRIRSALTIIGVVIGTICIVIMISLGLTNMEQFNETFIQNSNLTEIQIYGTADESGAGGLTEAAIESFRQIDGVLAASGKLEFPVYAVIGGYEADLYLSAVDPAVLSGLKLGKGTLFTSNAMPELVLGGEALKSFHDPDDASWQDQRDRKAPDVDWLNETLTLRFGYKEAEKPVSKFPAMDGEAPDAQAAAPKPRRYTARICGLTEASVMSEQSYQSYMDIAIARKLIQENRKLAEEMGLDANKYNGAVVMARDIDSVAAVLDEIRNMGYEAYSPADSIEEVQAEQSRQQGQLSLIAFISLLVSAIGIANTMLTSILERRAQIGVMKVVGLKISKIRAVFLLESALIGLTGGIIGSLLSCLFAFIVNGGAGGAVILGMYFGQGVQLVIPFGLILATNGIAVLVGVLSGIYPSVRATKMSPLEAIRG